MNHLQNTKIKSKTVPHYLRELAWQMAHCFSVVDNLDCEFVKAIIELPFTGEFVTDGWLPDILAKLHGSHEQLKKSLKFALGIE